MVRLRERAVLVMGCEGNDPGKCLTLARFAQDSKNDKAAADYLDRACAAGAFASCTEAANRFQATDSARATAALQKGCGGADGKSCARLAKTYEDGSAGKIDLAVAADYREKACSAGDGKSCRKLAAALDSGDDAADQKRAAELWRKGCLGGDQTSCNFARMTPVRSAVQEATYGARPAATTPPPAPSNAVPASTAPAAKQPLQLHPATSDNTPSPVGSLLIGAGILAGSGALYLAATDGDSNRGSGASSGRTRLVQTTQSAHMSYAPIVGAAALLSMFTGVGMVLHAQHEKEQAAQGVQVGVAPAGVVVSGKL